MRGGDKGAREQKVFGGAEMSLVDILRLGQGCSSGQSCRGLCGFLLTYKDYTVSKMQQRSWDLIHRLQRCPKLHRSVLATVNRIFQKDIPSDPMCCLLGVFDIILDAFTIEAVSRVLFQACKIILLYWKSTSPPSLKEWLDHMGSTFKI